MYRQGIHKNIKHKPGVKGEYGGLTIFSAVFVLILMTSMVIYATRVGLFETRISANEVRQKAAFHAAEAAANQGLMYLLSNADAILSSRPNAFPDGSGGFNDGWLTSGSAKWQPCPETLPDTPHPCGGDVAAPTGSFFYGADPDATTFESLPIDESVFPTGVTTRVSALLCFVNLGSTTCDGTVPSTELEESNAALVVTLLAYGYSDCSNTDDLDTCTGAATIAVPLASYSKLAGSPSVPLTVKSTLPLQGTFEVAPNPNGGGVGVPTSIWSNENACGGTTPVPITSQGTWQTCELQDWYGTVDPPPDVLCTTQCKCSPGNNVEDYLSYKPPGNGLPVLNMDIIVDPTFPCDLFQTYFGTPKEAFASVRDAPTTTILSNCDSLNAQSSGLIWISAGGTCAIGGNQIIGSPEHPVILISAAETSISGTPSLFGVFYIFDYPASQLSPAASADFTMQGTMTVYGALIIDAPLVGNASSTVNIIYNDAVLARANGLAGLGSVAGGWRDFGLPEIAW